MQKYINFDKSKVSYHLYLIADRTILGDRDFLQSIEDAISGGVTLVQLREKESSTLEFYNMAKQVKEITSKHNIPLIINDRLDIALAVDAEGLHIGQDDMPLQIARSILGSNKIVGVSASTLDEALKAKKDGADYLGVGAVFPTSSKDDAASVSIETLKLIKEKVKIPVVAIGGVNLENTPLVMNTGIDGIAVISAILKSRDIKSAALNLYKKVSETKI